MATSEKQRAYRAGWSKRNRDKKNAANRKWRKAHPEKAAKNSADWAKKNKAKIRAKVAAWAKANPEKRRTSRLLKYGLSLDGYRAMHAAQNGLCKICDAPPKEGQLLVVDHCHTTNKVRGLLCVLCNVGLGAYRDRQDLLLMAIQYLEEADGA